jgi:hypothetical protein
MSEDKMGQFEAVMEMPENTAVELNKAAAAIVVIIFFIILSSIKNRIT